MKLYISHDHLLLSLSQISELVPKMTRADSRYRLVTRSFYLFYTA